MLHLNAVKWYLKEAIPSDSLVVPFVTATILKHAVFEAWKKKKEKNPTKHFSSQQGNRLSGWSLWIAWWKACSWGYEEPYLFTAQAQAQVTKGKGWDQIKICHDYLCLVHTFLLHSTLNDTLKKMRRNIEGESIMLWKTKELATYLHNGFITFSKEHKFQQHSSSILWLNKVV